MIFSLFLDQKSHRHQGVEQNGDAARRGV